MQVTTSVLMAESAAMLLATVLLHSLDLQDSTLLSHNQQLVHFLNGADHSNPPDWTIKPYTQIIYSLLAATTSSIRKIRRSQNQMADLLARQALTVYHANHINISRVCTNPQHVQECPVLVALQSVTINSVMVLTASCC